MSEQMPAARTVTLLRFVRCLTQILMVATILGSLGVRPGAAQDLSHSSPVGESVPAPVEAVGSAETRQQAAPFAAPAAAEPLGKPIPASQGPAGTEGQIPPSPEATVKKLHDLTPMGMFLSAGPVVQAVMIVLAAASVVTWIILFARGAIFLLAKRRISLAIGTLRAAHGLADASMLVKNGVAARLLLETNEEVSKSQGLPSDGIKERALMALQRVEARAARRMASGTGVLATIGSIGPFVGLLGTVWGIMSSFIGIADSNTTSLAVVAPGIAEALLATGVGLAAAIPAVVIYNALARSITGYRAMLADAVALIMIHLSRDLDRRATIGGGANPTLNLAAE